jgi:hypothetical protein
MFQAKRETRRGMLAEIEATHGQTPTDVKTVAHNTLYYKIGDREFWRLHQTDILIHDPVKKTWTLSSGGWITNTTKDRLNQFGPVRIAQEKGQWFLLGRDKEGYPDHSVRYPFADGAQVDDQGIPLKIEALAAKGKETAKLLKQINGYCQKVTKTIREKGLPQPGPGDCWLCSMSEVGTGKGWGETTGDTSHLLEHIKEGYVHGSLIYRAMKARRSEGNLAYMWSLAKEKPTESHAVVEIAGDVRRYLRRALKVG